MESVVAAPQWRPRHDRIFFGGLAVALLLVTFFGFAPTYYLSGGFDAPALSPLVHLHGIVFSAWMLLFVAQTGFIATRRTDLHRRVGVFAAGLAVLVVILGVVVAIECGRHGGGGPQRNQVTFLVFPLTNILLFATFCLAGIRWRPQAGYHKRLMLLATLALAVTPLARLAHMMGLPFSPPAIGGMLLSDLFLIALVMFDVQSRGRVHPVTAWAGGIMLVSQPLRVMLAHTAAWQAFAHNLIG